MDVRSKKTEPFAQSEDQEDELLSIVPIKGYVNVQSSFSYSVKGLNGCRILSRGSKIVVGTQLGILSICIDQALEDIVNCLAPNAKDKKAHHPCLMRCFILSWNNFSEEC